MKGFVVVLLLVLMGMVGYNWWQIQTLQQEIVRLEKKVDERPLSLQEQALSAILRVQEAVKTTDWSRARTAYDEARAKVDQVARAAGDKGGQAIDWLKSQTSELGRQLQAHMPGR